MKYDEHNPTYDRYSVSVVDRGHNYDDRFGYVAGRPYYYMPKSKGKKWIEQALSDTIILLSS